MSFPNSSQETAELHPTTQALVVGDARIDGEILIIQNEFCLHILVLVKWILGAIQLLAPLSAPRIGIPIHQRWRRGRYKHTMVFLGGNWSGLVSNPWFRKMGKIGKVRTKYYMAPIAASSRKIKFSADLPIPIKVDMMVPWCPPWHAQIETQHQSMQNPPPHQVQHGSACCAHASRNRASSCCIRQTYLAGKIFLAYWFWKRQHCRFHVPMHRFSEHRAQGLAVSGENSSVWTSSGTFWAKDCKSRYIYIYIENIQ